MFLFLKKFGWWFHYSKWIYDIEHLESLVKTLECIASKVANSSNITNFCNIAKQVIERQAHHSKNILQQLEDLLQLISDDSVVRDFLGRREEYTTIGGGTFSGAWTSAKMYAFLLCIASWKGGKIYQFEFVEADSILGITSDDIRQHGHNTGAICRARIQMIWRNNGCPVTRPTALNEAKVAALTPRRTSQNSSVRTPLPSPRTEGSLTPMPSPRTEISSSARRNMYNHELTSSPLMYEMDIYILVFMLLDEKLLTFMRDAHNLTGLEKQGHIWFLYDILSWFGRFYGRGNVLFNPILQRTFFQTIFESKLARDALRLFLKEDPGYNSLEILTKRSAEKQQEFIDTLKMVVMHELWIVQSEGKVVMPFVYKTPQGVWKQDPETFVFYLVPLSQIVEAA
jgi:hypothetical protein